MKHQRTKYHAATARAKENGEAVPTSCDALKKRLADEAAARDEDAVQAALKLKTDQEGSRRQDGGGDRGDETAGVAEEETKRTEEARAAMEQEQNYRRDQQLWVDANEVSGRR
jgi:non-ribosomal peptide synthetase component F